MRKFITVLLVASLALHLLSSQTFVEYDPLWEDYVEYEVQFYKDRDAGLLD